VAEVRADKIEGAQINVEHLSIAYRDTVVLNDLSFEVRRGEFVSLVGSSGSGKTTLLNALAGFIPAEGEIKIPGKIGVVFQDYSVFPWMTVAQNIAFGLANGMWGNEAEIVRELLKLIQLEDKADRYPAELSGGQAQRVGIARAFAPDPDVIFMDEPYGALDGHTRVKMQQWLLEVWTARHKTVIFVTHDIDEAIFLSDRILTLSGKKIAAETIVPFQRPRTEEIKFSTDFIRLKREIYERMK
jgi:NitT/TauT family transport system ATP-binding protein